MRGITKGAVSQSVKQIEITRRTLGVNITHGETLIKVWVPKAKSVDISVESSFTLPLRAAEHGYWEGATNEIISGTKYKFVLDKHKELPDPASLYQPDGVFGASQVVDLAAFNWEDEQWINPTLNDYIIYEMHTGTFTTKGDFAAIEEKLPYLKELGITAIEIMPVAQFSGNRNWGYDGVFPFAVQNTYGGPEALQRLVNECHKAGIAVILDVVYNHIGPEGNYLSEYGHYFTDKYKTPWGDAINFDDAYSDEVRLYFIENVLMWLRDFHIDALRMDAVHAIKDMSSKHILKEIRECVDELIEYTGKQHHLIIECDLNDPHYINKEGYGMDAQWVDEFHHALRITSGQKPEGYYSDFNGIEHLAKSFKDAYVYDGQYSPHRLKTFGNKAVDNPGYQFIVFSQNHDQVGNRMKGDRTSHLVSFEMQKLLAATIMVSPFIPMLFMGEEWAAPNPYQYFVSHCDEELANAVRKGRKEEFSAFHQEGEVPDPVSENTFNNSKLQWEVIHKHPHNTLYNYYKALIILRKSHPVLQYTDRTNITADANKNNNTLVLHRWNKEDHILCLMNFSEEDQVVFIPSHQQSWQKIWDSASPEWEGKSAAKPIVKENEHIALQPESIIIYQ